MQFCGRETLLYRTVASWAKTFCRGREAGRPQSECDCVHVNAVRALLEEHRCWTCIELAEKVGIAPGTVLHKLKKLEMRKFCARWVPYNLKEENTWQRVETTRLHLERYGREGERFLTRIISLDKT